MFSHGLRECFEKSVTLYGVTYHAMELVLQYAYMGEKLSQKLDLIFCFRASYQQSHKASKIEILKIAVLINVFHVKLDISLRSQKNKLHAFF